MTRPLLDSQRSRINRRAFLRGTAGVALGLPFLESLPERSAWAAGNTPVFSLFICAVDGVVPASFFPDDLGELSVDALAAAGKATSKLSAHAKQLLFVRGINWAQQSPRAEPHAESLAMALTALPSTGTGQMATSTGPSADWVIARKVQGDTPPLTLYAGVKNGYINERLSFSDAGVVTPASNNPYELYQKLVGIVSPNGTPTPGAAQAQQLLLESRKSIHDLVRDDLQSLMANPRMSTADRQRLQQHFDAVRDSEVTLGNMGDELVRGCAWGGVEISTLEALKTFNFTNTGMIEDVVRLQMSLVALAFACNYNRTATLQWGGGTDHTVYNVPSNHELGMWAFNYICHRVQSDGGGPSSDPAVLKLAEKAHAEIDVLRMQTLAAGLDHFKARGLQDQSFVLWHNAIAYCDSFRSVPTIIWGNGGGHLKQAAYVDAGNTTNSPLLNALITAAIQDTGETMENFGAGPAGQLPAVLA
ncbi:MAG TPA: DUF1552 domain-containing protein [Polyangiaceae bacterium]|nr:DUF1552 domain-containing protein [Polyangiaceae bacterium]